LVIECSDMTHRDAVRAKIIEAGYEIH